MTKNFVAGLIVALKLLRTHWLFAALIGLGLFVALVSPSAWAASPGQPPHQTVLRVVRTASLRSPTWAGRSMD